MWLPFANLSSIAQTRDQQINSMIKPRPHHFTKYTHLTYIFGYSLFIELPPFERHRQSYLTDDQFFDLQTCLLSNPTAGDVIRGTGGLRKLRFKDKRRSEGKRGGLRVIYFGLSTKQQFWLFTLYDKHEMQDLGPDEARQLKSLLKAQLEIRQ